MIETASFLHYLAVGIMTAVCSIGVGLGQGAVSLAALRAINTQPMASNPITRVAVFGMVLLEFAAIAGVTFGLFLAFGTSEITLAASIAEIGIAAAICIAGCMVGIACYYPAKEACLAAARQPFFAATIMRFMLLSQSIIQTPVIFAFIVGVFIKSQLYNLESIPEGLRLLAAGLCMGIGSVGPAIGMAYFAKTACKGLGINRDAYPKLLRFTFISQAIIETPLLFAFLVSLFILGASTGNSMVTAIGLLAAGLCMGIGTFGPGISSGKTSAAACEQIAFHPAMHGILSRISMISQGIIDSSAIYSFLIALLIYFL